MPDLSEAAVRSRWAALVAKKPCAVWSCDRPASRRRLCTTHYARWHRAAHRRAGMAGLLFTRTLPDPTEAELEALA